MHYANCNTYNADFDGDEMNLHMCQTELARAEAYRNRCNRSPIYRAHEREAAARLIQDHVAMGVMLTKRDTFLTKAEFSQILFSSGLNYSKTLRLVKPAVLKPVELWTGKQVITALLLHLHRDAIELNMQAGSKTPASAWAADPASVTGVTEDEAKVVVRGGELLSGVLDKSAFGATDFGLVHSVNELLGGEATGRLITQLGRLFTCYGSMLGQTCGIADVLLTPEADAKRSWSSSSWPMAFASALSTSGFRGPTWARRKAFEKRCGRRCSRPTPIMARSSTALSRR